MAADAVAWLNRNSAPDSTASRRPGTSARRRCRPGNQGILDHGALAGLTTRASRSSTTVLRPSDEPYTAAARPAGPAPTISPRSHSSADGRLRTPSASATSRLLGPPEHGRRSHGHGQRRRLAQAGVLQDLQALVRTGRRRTRTRRRCAQAGRAARASATPTARRRRARPRRPAAGAATTGRGTRRPPGGTARRALCARLVRRQLDLPDGALTSGQDGLRRTPGRPRRRASPARHRVDRPRLAEEVGTGPSPACSGRRGRARPAGLRA